jgi:hypothetical protein
VEINTRKKGFYAFANGRRQLRGAGPWTMGMVAASRGGSLKQTIEQGVKMGNYNVKYFELFSFELLSTIKMIHIT